MDFQEPSSGPVSARRRRQRRRRGGSGCRRLRRRRGEYVTELAALVDRAWGGDADMARHPTGRRELPEEAPHSGCIPRDLRVDLRVGSLQVHVRQTAGPP